MLACDGAIRLQCEHLALVDWISLVMQGQKIDDSAFDIMVDVLHEEQISMRPVGKEG